LSIFKCVRTVAKDTFRKKGKTRLCPPYGEEEWAKNERQRLRSRACKIARRKEGQPGRDNVARTKEEKPQ